MNSLSKPYGRQVNKSLVTMENPVKSSTSLFVPFEFEVQQVNSASLSARALPRAGDTNPVHWHDTGLQGARSDLWWNFSSHA